MPKTAVIFDLDDTLVDTSELSHLRENRDWKECFKRIPETKMYDGLLEAITSLKNLEIPIGIVTSSISDYANEVLDYHDIPHDTLIAYHDCPPHLQKPNPAPVIKCLGDLDCSAEGSLGIGDLIKDAQAYKSAGIKAWGAGWSRGLCRDTEWDEIIDTLDPVVSFFQDK